MWIHRKEHFRNASSAPERSKVAATVYFRPDTAEAPRPKDGTNAAPIAAPRSASRGPRTAAPRSAKSSPPAP